TLKIKSEWANDFDIDSCKTYALNIEGNINSENVICSDVSKVDIASLRPIDIFIYGFPCNDFSIVGERLGFQGKFGPLYAYGVSVLDYHKPLVFVAENVGGINSTNQGKAFEKILHDLENAGNGYNLTVHLYRSQDYGVPQTRHRYVIVGIDKKLNKEFKVPEPTHLGKPVTAGETLSNIPRDAHNHEIPTISEIVRERLTHIRPGENVWNAELPEHLKLNVKSARLSQIYKRLHPDKPSYTITGSGGGGTHGYHYLEPRPLTNRERARLQTFPDEFKFIGNYSSVRKQIGMAVPVRLSNIIFNAVLDTLNDKSYPYIKANYVLKSPESRRLRQVALA
ncbi:MAG TPA: DNA (cytosine-5-)-methyltransferase, partial [Candidatus Saccharimonadales bacterium]|nr:DNA (cytosine-5-)-methyltransferase [Candidatus Saccharimonadales bacterium]